MLINKANFSYPHDPKPAEVESPERLLLDAYPAASQVAFERSYRREMTKEGSHYKSARSSRTVCHVHFGDQCVSGAGQTVHDCIKSINHQIAAMSMGLDQATRLRDLVERQKLALLAKGGDAA